MKSKPFWGLLLGASIIGFSPLFVKAISVGPTWQGFFRCFLGGLALQIAASVRVKRDPISFFKTQKLPSKFWWLCLAAAAFFAGDLYVWNRSVVYAGAGIGTILGNTQVFYAALYAVVIFHEKLRPRLLLAILLAFLGVLLLVLHQTPDVTRPHFLPGVFYGLATGVFYGGFLMCLRLAEMGFPKISSMQKLAIIMLMTSAILFVLSWPGGEIVMPPAQDWPYFLGLAIWVQLIGWSLISSNSTKLPHAKTCLILLAQPTVAAIGGWMLFNEALGPLQILGAILTLFAIYWGGRKSK